MLDKYIFKQIFTITILGILVFIIFWISPEILFRIIKKCVNGEISTIMAFKLFFLEIPEILGKAIPVGIMIGCIFVFDRLSRDSELIIIRNTGVSFMRLLVPVAMISILGIIGCFITYEKLIPFSTSYMNKLKNTTYSNQLVYPDKTKDGKISKIIVIGKYDGITISNFKLLTFSSALNSSTPLIKSILTAENAIWKKDHWELLNGKEYIIAADGVYKSINSFTKKETIPAATTPNAYKYVANSIKNQKEMTFKELYNYNKLLKGIDMQEEANSILNKFYQRFAQPFSCILLALCGMLLGFSKPRDKRLLGFTIGVAIIFLYYLIVPFLDMLTQTGIILPIIAAWTPNIMITIAIILLVKYKNI